MLRTCILITFYLSALAVSIRFGPGSQAGSSGTGGAGANTIQNTRSSTRQIHDQCVGVKILPARNINAAPPEPNRGGANRAAQPASNAIVPEPIYQHFEPNTGEPPVPPNTPIKRDPVPPPNGVPPVASNGNQPVRNLNTLSQVPRSKLFGNCKSGGRDARPAEVALDSCLGWDTVMDKGSREAVAGAVNMSGSLRIGTESIVGAIMWAGAPWNMSPGDPREGRLRSHLIKMGCFN
ncbi:hypothetical protein BDV40DRAFT_300434 [Aspergillus tamarii]|uniref:Uncharacterized protein n=1 Tax=Aspergillus tamarii TaxID=41984 RepID=A0A5N6UUT2_ASPTM|nr:hypothetical protein BDV40DRAFT_300434 [Aspergillus tamarii]